MAWCLGCSLQMVVWMWNARPMKVTFNRAFDVSANLDRSLEDVIASGVDRILTSGGERLGMHGATNIARLTEAASGRITILGAGGIRNSNISKFVLATGVNEIHTSLRTRAKASVPPDGAEGILGAYTDGLTRYVVTEEEVTRVRRTLDAIAGIRKDATPVQ